MNPREFIIARQIEWARNQDIDLVGSQGVRGRKAYTTSIDHNIFQPLNKQTEKELREGDGAELQTHSNIPSKIQAVHSSSALGVNIFDYWRNQGEISTLMSACRLIRSRNYFAGKIRFEQKFPIDDRFKYAPNIDVVIYPDDPETIKLFAIECKFTESYASQSHGGLDEKYLLNSGLWEKLPNTETLARKISPKDTEFTYLHAAQLIKHILGLNRKCGHKSYRLLYLWYDALREPGWKHNKEVERFAEVVKADGVHFHSLTYQKLIVNLAKNREQHGEYIRYLTERYL